MATSKDPIAVQTVQTTQTSSSEPSTLSQSQSQSQSQTAHAGKNASVTVTGHGQDRPEDEQEEDEQGAETVGDQVDTQKKGFLAYFKTKEFYITLVLGSVYPSSVVPVPVCTLYKTADNAKTGVGDHEYSYEHAEQSPGAKRCQDPSLPDVF